MRPSGSHVNLNKCCQHLGQASPVDGGWGVVVSLDTDVRVHLADGLGVLLEDFVVPSGDAADRGAEESADRGNKRTSCAFWGK